MIYWYWYTMIFGYFTFSLELLSYDTAGIFSGPKGGPDPSVRCSSAARQVCEWLCRGHEDDLDWFGGGWSLMVFIWFFYGFSMDPSFIELDYGKKLQESPRFDGKNPLVSCKFSMVFMVFLWFFHGFSQQTNPVSHSSLRRRIARPPHLQAIGRVDKGKKRQTPVVTNVVEPL